MFLDVDGIHTFYGKAYILQGISLGVRTREIIALLGRNGVGKSTTLKSIMGLVFPRKGSIGFKGEKIVGLTPYEICRLGIGYVPEDNRIFPNLTVRQNLLIGIRANKQIDNPWTIERVYSYFPQLGSRDHQKGRRLSGGEQKMLSICRTLMGNPELLLIDEPTEGLAPALIDMVVWILREVNQMGVSIVLVEQAMDIALELATQAYVLSKGRVVFCGTSGELYNNEEVRKKYLEV